MSIRSQKMAQDAYPLVDNMRKQNLIKQYSQNNKSKEFEKKCGQLEKDYRTQALNLPTMILQAGLCQTVGFLLAKGKDKDENKQKEEDKNPLPNQYSLILNHLADLLSEDKKTKYTGSTLHQKIIAQDFQLTEYQLLTRKALDASSWLKRYAQALLKDPKDQENP